MKEPALKIDGDSLAFIAMCLSIAIAASALFVSAAYVSAIRTEKKAEIISNCLKHHSPDKCGIVKE